VFKGRTVEAVFYAAVGLLTISLIVLTLPAALGCQRSRSRELEVKAAFVLNFIRLIDWPRVNEDTESSLLPVCGLASGPVFERLRDLANGKQVAGKAIHVSIVREPNAASCRVLLFESEQYTQAAPLLKSLRNAPVLTVGTDPGFIRMGGMLELVVEDRRVQFDAGLEAIQSSGLQVSASLLRLAHNLQKEKSAEVRQ
jgi:hypothetical protein